VALLGFVVVVVTTPADAFLAFALYGLALSFLVGLARMPLGLLARRLLLLVPFLLMVAVFLPFLHRSGAGGFSIGNAQVSTDGLLVLFNVAAKALLAVTATGVLFYSTGLVGILAGMERLRVPSVFVLMLAFLHRYSFVLVEEFQHMRTAMASRNYRARWLWQGGALGHLIGALFLRSYERAERVHMAMLSRGYTGTRSHPAPAALCVRDGAFMAGITAFAVSVRVLVPHLLP
jgi:cobalt/nickel transport system permease protein